MENRMIHARDLTRTFKTKTETVAAVRGLSLDVKEGELVAFLGPNGAGKSTSVRMLTTLLKPDSGHANVAGHDVATDAIGVRQQIGYVGQGAGAGQYHQVRDELITQGLAQRMTRAAAKKRADELIGMLELTGLEKRLGSTLSGGQKRRLDVALGLMHTPKILFLDEPTTGLDPQSRANLWDHVGRLRKATGMTIFLTTHYLDEADTQAERVMVMDNGTMIADDTPARLKANLAGDRISLVLTGEGESIGAATMAENLPGVREVSRDGLAVSVTADGGEALLPEFIRRLHDTGTLVASASVRRPTLDDVFLSLTGRSLRDANAGAAAA
jgi:ABC-2 type transport system ATP-binding protein